MESEYRGVSSLTLMIALGSVFMSKPYETLKNWTHSGVLSSPDAAGECRNGFARWLAALLKAPQYCPFASRVGLRGEGKVL